MGQRVTANADTLARLCTGTVEDILDQPGIECQCLDLAVKPTDLRHAGGQPRLRTLQR